MDPLKVTLGKVFVGLNGKESAGSRVKSLGSLMNSLSRNVVKAGDGTPTSQGKSDTYYKSS